MKVSNTLWRERRVGQLPETLAEEIEHFGSEIELRRQGKLDEKIFAETRLRRGAYGQRYDNGQRHDGQESRKLAYPEGNPTKGPNTLWDAPGMLRIKIPYGGMNPQQLEAMAELAEAHARLTDAAGTDAGNCGNKLTSRARLGVSGLATTWPKYISSTTPPSRFIR